MDASCHWWTGSRASARKGPWRRARWISAPWRRKGSPSTSPPRSPTRRGSPWRSAHLYLESAAKLRDGGPEAHRELPTGNLTQEWQGCCRGHGVEPIIPEALRGCVRHLGPTPEDRKRDKGILLEREKRRLAPNTQGYQMYLFRELEDAPPLLDSPARPVAEVREDFLGALREAESFAEQQDSPFFEAFKLARFVLKSGGLRLTGTSLRSGWEHSRRR
jgi:hypothetical protein